MRFAAIKDCFSLVSIIIFTLGFGQVGSFSVEDLEKMFGKRPFDVDEILEEILEKTLKNDNLI